MTSSPPVLPEFDIDHLSLASSISAETGRMSPSGSKTPTAVDSLQLSMATSSTPRPMAMRRQSSSANSSGLGLAVHGYTDQGGLSRAPSGKKGKEKETDGADV